MHLLNSVGVLFKINMLYCPEYSILSKCTKFAPIENIRIQLYHYALDEE